MQNISKLSIPGITPAYAGNTTLIHLQTSKFWDHPRLRGEHSLNAPASLNFVGSPPPTRGTPNLIRDGTVLVGITPAYAGNTQTLPVYLT